MKIRDAVTQPMMAGLTLSPHIATTARDTITGDLKTSVTPSLGMKQRRK